MTTSEEVPQELVEAFQVQELEERVEFAAWSASCEVSGGYDGEDGHVEGTCSVGVSSE